MRSLSSDVFILSDFSFKSNKNYYNFLLSTLFFSSLFSFSLLRSLCSLSFFYMCAGIVQLLFTCTIACTTSSSTTSSQTPPPPHNLIRDYWYELKFSDLFKFINPDGRYQCPRFNCMKSYKDASSLQRHIRQVTCLVYTKKYIGFQSEWIRNEIGV